MRDGPWWILPLVVVGSTLIILYVIIFTLLPIPRSEELVASGLFLNICGAVITLVPDIVGVDKLFEPTERIEKIEEAQEELIARKSINSEFDGYDELIEVIMEIVNQDVEPFPESASISSGGYGVPNLYVMFHHHEYETINAEGIGKFVEHSSLIDSRVSEYVERLKSRGHQLGFALGIFLLLLGFISQFAAIVL